MDQADFLRLLTAQLKNQDPTKPLDGQQFMAQLAQFSTLNGIIEMKESLDGLVQSLQSTSSLQAANLVGRSVLIDSNKAHLNSGEPIKGRTDVTENVNNLTVVVTDASGREVRRLNLGAKSSSVVDFQWDGLDSNGAQAAPGLYTFTVEGTVADGKTANFAIQTWAKVSSVFLGQLGEEPILDLAGLGRVGLSQISAVN